MQLSQTYSIHVSLACQQQYKIQVNRVATFTRHNITIATIKRQYIKEFKTHFLNSCCASVLNI